MTGMLLMDVKGSFDHVSRNELIGKMVALRANGNMVR